MKYPLFSKHSSPLHPSYSQSHHSPSSTPPHNLLMEVNVESIITKWDINSKTQHEDKFFSLFFGDRSESRRFLEAVNTLHTSMHHHLNNQSSNTQKLIKDQNLMKIAMKRLEKEFYVILNNNRKTLDSESVSNRSSTSTLSISDSYEDDNSDEITTTSSPRTPRYNNINSSDLAMTDLRNIAECMIGTGYGRECVNIYKLIRKSIIDETLYYLEVANAKSLKHSQMLKMEWSLLEQKIKSWIRALKVAVKTLFQGEKLLCYVVFASSEKTAESCFTEIAKEAAVTLFNFPQNLVKSNKILSPDKMFRVLDMHEAICELWPLIESIFSHDSVTIVRSEAISAVVKLAEAVRVMLKQFESAVQKDTSKAPANGGVHPLTRYVMNFLVFLGDYSGAISDILSDSPVVAHTPLPESYFASPISGAGEDPSAAAITNRLAWLILVLLCKLDGKAVHYNNAALSYLFLANNLNYVVSKIRNSSLGLLMGPDWIWKHAAKVKRYVANYERMAWSEVMSSLPEDPTAEISTEEVMERFRRFNLSFSQAYKTESSWVIPDSRLRDEVKVSLAKKIIPVYRVFYINHRGNYVREVGVEPIVRYAPEDLDNYLSDLFFGAVEASGGSTTSSYAASSVLSHGRS